MEQRQDISPEKIVALESVFRVIKRLTLMASSHSLVFCPWGHQGSEGRDFYLNQPEE